MDLHRTLTGQLVDLSALSAKERAALARMRAFYEQRPDWTEFSRTWMAHVRDEVWGRENIPVGCPLHQVCHDLEMRLGVTQGQVALPDFRERLPELIADKFGSRYAYCKAAGIDQGNLSHVLYRRKDFSAGMLERAVEAVDGVLQIVPIADVLGQVTSDPSAPDERLTQLGRVAARLEDLAARVARAPARRRAAMVPKPLLHDGLDGLRARLKKGEPLDRALAAEREVVLREKAALAREVAAEAERELRRLGEKKRKSGRQRRASPRPRRARSA